MNDNEIFDHHHKIYGTLKTHSLIQQNNGTTTTTTNHKSKQKKFNDIVE